MTDMEQMAVQKAMAHPIRWWILRLLPREPSCATHANQTPPVSQLAATIRQRSGVCQPGGRQH